MKDISKWWFNDAAMNISFAILGPILTTHLQPSAQVLCHLHMMHNEGTSGHTC